MHKLVAHLLRSALQKSVKGALSALLASLAAAFGVLADFPGAPDEPIAKAVWLALVVPAFVALSHFLGRAATYDVSRDPNAR